MATDQSTTVWLLLLPYFKGIDSMAQGLAVSLVAPDGRPGGGTK